MRDKNYIPKSKRMLLFIFAVFILAVSCSKNDSPLTADDTTGSIKAKISDDLIGAQILITQGNEIERINITDSGTVVEFSELEAGNYELKIIMPDGNVFVKPVNVEDGRINYVGEIAVISNGGQGGQAINSDFVNAHAPPDGKEIIFNRPDKYHPEPTSRLSVSVQFSKPMDRRSIQQALSVEPAVEGYFTWNSYFISNSQRVVEYDLLMAGAPVVEKNSTFIPSAEISTFSDITSFTYNFSLKDSYTDTTYRIKISTAAKDSAGEFINKEFSFSFSTIQSAFSMDEIITDPQNGEDYVNLISTNGIKVTFPRRMDQASVDSNILVTPQGNYIYLWQDYNILIIYTGGQLLPQTKYSIFVDSLALDIEGNPLGSAYTSTFYTAPLYLKSSDPPNGKLGVSKSKDLKLTFNSYMDLDKTKDKIILVDDGGNSVPISIYYHSYRPYNTETVYYLDQIIVNPTMSLSANRKYTVKIASGAGDLLGGTTNDEYKIVFVTMP